MKANYLWYTIAFIVMAFIMYHLTYFLLWFFNLPTTIYALLLLAFIVLTSVALYNKYKDTDAKNLIKVLVGGCFFGYVYALGPSMLHFREKYYEGFIIRCTDLSSIFRGEGGQGLPVQGHHVLPDRRRHRAVHRGRREAGPGIPRGAPGP